MRGQAKSGLGRRFRVGWGCNSLNGWDREWEVFKWTFSATVALAQSSGHVLPLSQGGCGETPLRAGSGMDPHG